MYAPQVIQGAENLKTGFGCGGVWKRIPGPQKMGSENIIMKILEVRMCFFSAFLVTSQ